MAFGTQDDTDEVMNEINMTPFVDVMLVLLIIFIITVPVMKHAVNVDLPRASSQRQDAKPETVRLSVQADGTYYWNESKVTDEALPGLLRAEAAQRTPSPTCTSAATRRCATSAWPRPWPRPSRRACARSASSPNRSREQPHAGETDPADCGTAPHIGFAAATVAGVPAH
jgi:biopolymer transport protein ExbD